MRYLIIVITCLTFACTTGEDRREIVKELGGEVIWQKYPNGLVHEDTILMKQGSSYRMLHMGKNARIYRIDQITFINKESTQ